MKYDITIKNIKQYIEGNGQKVLEKLNLQPEHIQEQIAYRRIICSNDCKIKGKCIKCGCEFYGKTSVKESCNLDRFPNFMSKIDWEEFKKENNVN
jgi:hypothetical protein